MAREINLVPDIKGEMIKALKLRNFIFYLCIVVVAASVGVSLIFFSIAAGQKAVVAGKTDTIEELSKKLNSYSDLSDFLTIKDQLGNLSSISNNKKLLSRTFGVLSAILPTGADTITISELGISLEEESPTITLEAQANAGKDPFIDYNVLDAFKKSMQYMRYDYGTYVDKEGNDIPAYCMIETGSDGASLMDPTKGRFAYWNITADGCAPASYEPSADTSDDDEENDSDTTVETEEKSEVPVYSGYETEEYNGKRVVRIWRTPQYSSWYKKDSDDSYLSLDGTISGVAHFESSCTSYEGKENGDKIEWYENNTECLLVPDGTDGIVISESSNGRDANDELVLRFNATITLNSEIFDFNNKHLISLGPSTRYNVTDSYVQVQNMFGRRASDCAANDTSCKNANGGSN